MEAAGTLIPIVCDSTFPGQSWSLQPTDFALGLLRPVRRSGAEWADGGGDQDRARPTLSPSPASGPDPWRRHHQVATRVRFRPPDTRTLRAEEGPKARADRDFWHWVTGEASFTLAAQQGETDRNVFGLQRRNDVGLQRRLELALDGGDDGRGSGRIHWFGGLCDPGLHRAQGQRPGLGRSPAATRRRRDHSG